MYMLPAQTVALSCLLHGPVWLLSGGSKAVRQLEGSARVVSRHGPMLADPFKRAG